MARNTWIVGGVAVAAVAVLLLLTMGPSTPGTGDVDNAQATALIEDGIRLIDVRTPAEYGMGHIPGAENVPLDSLSTAATGWDPTQPVLVYCATGNRSLTALRSLGAAGFTTVYNLKAGIAAWDGDIVTGSQTAALPAAPATGSDLPVMYEFFTDW